MSSYLGPYVEAKYEMQERMRLMKGCPKCETDRWGSKFCPTCGTACGTFEMPQTIPKVEPWNLRGKLSERLSHFEYTEPNICLWQSNITDALERDLWEFDNQAPLEITAKLIEDEKHKFVDFYARDIKKLMVAYGSENIAIKWGLITE